MKPHWWEQANAELSAADPVLARIIERSAGAFPVSRGDPFMTLARSIVGQQISVKAAQAVWERVEAKAGEFTPDRLCRMRASTLQGCGLSVRKAEYVKDLAQHFAKGSIDPARWPELDDETIIGELVEVRGIGRWTAEMFLIFNLLRPDVFPVDDLGLLRGIALHFTPEHAPQPGQATAADRAAKQRAIAVGERWRPWRTAATWHLWRSLDPVPVEY